MSLQNPIVNNTELRRFETSIDGEFAYITYRFHGDDMALMHTFVPLVARNKGIAWIMARFVLDYVKHHNLKVKVYCSSVAKYIKHHPEYETLLAENGQGRAAAGN
jgi:uncharacterized protein